MSARCYQGPKLAEINLQNSEHDQEYHDAYLSIPTSTFFADCFRVRVFYHPGGLLGSRFGDTDLERRRRLDGDRITTRQFQEAKLDGPSVIIGKPPELAEFVRRILSEEFPQEVEATPTAAWVRRIPNGHPVLLICIRDTTALNALRLSLPDCGRRSFIAFEGRRAVTKGVWRM